MKKLVLFLTIALPTSVFTQLAPPTQKFNLHLTSNNILDRSTTVRTGPIMILGGASFIVAGALTTPTYVGGSTTKKKPFFQQGGRSLAILSGGIVLSVGCVISISGN
jgi:hypothetical protein